MHGPRTPRSALAARILALVTTVWLLVGVPAGVARRGGVPGEVLERGDDPRRLEAPNVRRADRA
ncbi:hypothetical protein ABT049_33980, partial [Streptomyces sp. NPDC002553]